MAKNIKTPFIFYKFINNIILCLRYFAQIVVVYFTDYVSIITEYWGNFVL